MKFSPASAFQIQRLDQIAIQKFKIPSLGLMENAGRKSSQIILKSLKSQDKVAIFCGKGNNGGDGMVVARYLLQAGIRPKVFLLGQSKDLKPDALVNYQRLIKLGGRVKEIANSKALKKVKPSLNNCALMVDAIFGVGLRGNPSSFYLSAIDFLNQTEKPIVSIDVPSGLDATSGRRLGNCVKASQTITFSLAKKGFFRNQGPAFCGKIKVVDIGIPDWLIKKVLKVKCR